LSPDGGLPARVPESVDKLVVDPKAEGVPKPGTATAQDEDRFYSEDAERYKLLHAQQNLGQLGKLWGSSTSAPTNIAGLLLVLCFVLVALSFLPTQSVELVDARKWLYSVTTMIVGFLFGARTAGKSE
jgi:hypothetical protein